MFTLHRLRSEWRQNQTVEELPTRKRGCYFLLKEVEMQVRVYLKALHEIGAMVDTAFVTEYTEGISRDKDSSLLESIVYVKWRASTKAKVGINDIKAVKALFLLVIQVIVEMEMISHYLIININCD